MKNSSSRTEQRRHQILEAAMRVFARTGFHQARMDDVAQEAGVSKGLLYWYYRSKDALIAAILERIFSWELRDLEAVHAMEGSASERLRELARRIARGIQGFSFLMPIALEFYAVAGRRKEIRETLQAYYARYQSLVEDILREGKEQGEFREDLDVSNAALTLLALFEGLVLLYAVNPKTLDFAHMSITGIEQLLRGWRRHPQDRGARALPP